MIRATTSASNIHRRALCPGSERLEAGLPEEKSAQSDEGTLLHQYDANPKLDRATLKPNQQDLLRIMRDLDTFVFERVEQQFGIGPEEAFEEGNEREIIALPKTPLETPGHCDRWRYYPKRELLAIVDKKTGFKEVTPAAANYQLRTYAIAGTEEWAVQNVVVAITQPRLSFERRVTMAGYSVDDIAAATDELLEIRKGSLAPDAPLVAGEEQCRYCKAKLICDAYKAKLAEGMTIVPVTDGTVAKREADAARTLAECTDQQLDRVLVFLQFANFVKDIARDEARKRIEAGGFTQWKLGKASEVRNVVDPKRAVALLTLRGDLTRDEVLAHCTLKLGEIEDAIRDKKKLTWKEARDVIDQTLGAVIEKEPKKASLTRVK